MAEERHDCRGGREVNDYEQWLTFEIDRLQRLLCGRPNQTLQMQLVAYTFALSKYRMMK